MKTTNEFLQELWAMGHLNTDVQAKVALYLDEKDRELASKEAALAQLQKEHEERKKKAPDGERCACGERTIPSDWYQLETLTSVHRRDEPCYQKPAVPFEAP